MITVYAIRHKTTQRYLSSDPCLGQFHTTAAESEALGYVFMSEAEMHRLTGCEPFANAYEVIPLSRGPHDRLHD